MLNSILYSNTKSMVSNMPSYLKFYNKKKNLQKKGKFFFKNSSNKYYKNVLFQDRFNSNYKKFLCCGTLFVLLKLQEENQETFNKQETIEEVQHNKNLFISTLPFYSQAKQISSLVDNELKNIKQFDNNDNNFILESGVCVIPHPQKVAKGGEDAYFITEKCIGVADGVGGWAEQGIDPALYSKKLMEGAILAIEKFNKDLNPRSILWEAYNFAKDTVGSSTACIVTVNKNYLQACNIGDTGIMIIRDSKIVLRSKEQQYTFNFPYQLGTASDITPDNADNFYFEVMENDLIIIGSDGLFDNLYDEEIVEFSKNKNFFDFYAKIVQNTNNSNYEIINSNTEKRNYEFIKSPVISTNTTKNINKIDNQHTLSNDNDTNILETPQEIANRIANAASTLSQVWFRNSPFAATALKYGQSYFGGKIDDITVVVSRVVKKKNINK